MDCYDLTAHADRDELVDFAVRLNPRTILLGHGEPEARDWMEQTLRERLPKLIIHQPAPGEAVEV
jgi:Cft2 family RNA processing exonuclease